MVKPQVVILKDAGSNPVVQPRHNRAAHIEKINLLYVFFLRLVSTG